MLRLNRSFNPTNLYQRMIHLEMSSVSMCGLHMFDTMKTTVPLEITVALGLVSLI